jgi:hypothetical protein
VGTTILQRYRTIDHVAPDRSAPTNWLVDAARLAPNCTYDAVHIDEGFDSLGYHIRLMRKRGN